MAFEKKEAIGGWYLLDPEEDGMERIVDEESLENPIVVINDKTKALEYLAVELEDWNAKSESNESSAGMLVDNAPSPATQCEEEDRSQDVYSTTFVDKIIVEFAIGAKEMFAIECRHPWGHTEPKKIPINMKRGAPIVPAVPNEPPLVAVSTTAPLADAPSVVSVPEIVIPLASPSGATQQTAEIAVASDSPVLQSATVATDEPTTVFGSAIVSSPTSPSLSNQQITDIAATSASPVLQPMSIKPDMMNKAFDTNPQTRASNNIVLPPKLTGFITKQGSFFRTWKRRYFVLDDHVLSYYNGPEDLEKGIKCLGKPFKIHNKVGAQTVITQNGLVRKSQCYTYIKLFL
jgi:hypothetical protein